MNQAKFEFYDESTKDRVLWWINRIQSRSSEIHLKGVKYQNYI